LYDLNVDIDFFFNFFFFSPPSLDKENSFPYSSNSDRISWKRGSMQLPRVYLFVQLLSLSIWLSLFRSGTLFFV